MKLLFIGGVRDQIVVWTRKFLLWGFHQSHIKMVGSYILPIKYIKLLIIDGARKILHQALSLPNR